MAFCTQRLHSQRGMRQKDHAGLTARGARGCSLTYSHSPTAFFSLHPSSPGAVSEEESRIISHHPRGLASGGRHSLRVSGTSPEFHKVLFWGNLSGTPAGNGKRREPRTASGISPPTTGPARASSAAHCPGRPASCAASRTPAPGSVAPRPSNAAAPLTSSTRGTYRGRRADFSK